MSNQNGVQWQAGDIILDLYKVIGILGQGEFGEVYKVRHLGWNIDLAVQNPSSALISTLGGVESFENQIKPWIDLELHPHVVRCYYLRRVNDYPLVFTEYVAGGSLRRWISDRSLYANGSAISLRRILDIAIQAAWGLHYAHEQGVVHQNVTPESCLMTPDGRAKLSDFGWVKSEAIAGAYRAPEQMHSGTALTAQTDLWGWGLTVLEMFTGQRTWTAGTLAKPALEHYLEKGTKDSQIARMPEPVAQLLERCFQEPPEKRPAQLGEVAEELQDIYHKTIGRTYPRRQPLVVRNTAENLNNKAVLLWDLGQRDEALMRWEQALDLQPQHLESIYNRGLMLWRLGKVSDDRALLRQLEANRVTPQDWQTDYLLSLVHLERGDYETALKLLESLYAKGIQQEEVRTALALAKERVPHTRRLLSQLTHESAARQDATAAEITSIALSPTNRYALSGEQGSALRLWDIATGRCLCVFRGHQGRVSAVAFSPDGCYVLSGGTDQTLQLWNVADNRHVHTFGSRERQAGDARSAPAIPLLNQLRNLAQRSQPQAHQGAIQAVAFSPDSRYILSGGDDKVIKLWELSTGKCLRTFQHRRGRILAVLFTPDQQQVISASDDQIIKVWDISTGQVKQTFEGHQDLTSMACSTYGRYILAGANPIKMWDLNTGQLIRTFEASGVRSVAFSPDGRFVLSGGDDQQLKLWEIQTTRCLRTLEGHSTGIRALTLSSDGYYALSADAVALNWWSVYSTSDPDLAPLRLSQMPLSDASMTSDRFYEQELNQAQIALERGDAVTAAQHIRQARSQPGYNRGMEAVQTWLNLYTALPRRSLSTAWEQATFDRYAGALNAVSFSPDGSSVLLGSADTTLKLWDIATSRCLLSLEGHRSEVTAVAFSPEGRLMLSGSADQTLRLWDASTGECLRTLSGHAGVIHSVAFSPTGDYALSGSADKTLKLWEVSTGRCLRSLNGHQEGVLAIAFSPDGRFIVSSSADKTLRRWEIATGNCVGLFDSHIASIHAVALTADGRYALSASADQTLKLWNITTGECLRTFVGHTAVVRSVSLSTDGRYALSGSDDKTCKLWNLVTGDCLWTFAGHTAVVRSVGLSSDGRYALSGSDDKTAKLWLLDWELADQMPADWDEGANPYLEVFLRLQTPSVELLPDNREPTEEEINLALTPQSTPIWSEADFSRLMQTLKVAGYGWLRPEGVRQQLMRLTEAILFGSGNVEPKPVPRPAVNPTTFATAFGTEFATAFATSLGEPEPLARVVLTVTAGSLQGQEFDFSNRTICLIGRAKDCHLQLPNDEQHKTISRYHCMLDINPPVARIRDLGSLHGTYVNGQMIGRRQRNQTPEQAMYDTFPEHDLATGDEIKLGQTVFRVRLEGVNEETALPSVTAFSPPTAFSSPDPLLEPTSGSRVGSNSNRDIPADSTAIEEVKPPAIEGYTFVRQLGSSEVGQVYLARHELTRNLVALKVMFLKKAVRVSVVEQFLQAIDKLKALQHPHIVQLLDSGYTDGTFFFALEYCDGSNVFDLMQQRGGKLPVREALSITLQILEGLEYAHRQGQGLLHCQLKPSNILLAGGLSTVTGNAAIAKIADYGLAKAFDRAGLGGLSMSGSTANLPVFMPRQQAVNFNYASAEVDVWASAACLYYMLTGTYPRNFSHGKDPYLVLLQTEPVSIRDRAPEIPAALAQLIDRALVDNPEITFKSATALKQALKQVAM